MGIRCRTCVHAQPKDIDEYYCQIDCNVEDSRYCEFYEDNGDEDYIVSHNSCR